MRSSKFSVFARAVFIVFVIYMALAWLWNSITLSNDFTMFQMAISAILFVLIFGGFVWLLVRISMFLIYGKSSEYRAYRESGGDPFFDSIPWPANPDSKLVRMTGIAEPKTKFHPPSDWNYQCPQCGARVPSRVGVCWNCNYGADGDSSVYLKKFGYTKPSDISQEEWNKIIHGETESIFPDDEDGSVPVDERP